MSRLKSLQEKEQELINESVICNSLISQILTKINKSITQLEVEDNKPEFRSLYLSTLRLTDKINEKLVEINLELEEFILDKQIDTNELDNSIKTASNINLLDENTTPKVLNIDKECPPGGENATSLAGSGFYKQDYISDETYSKVCPNVEQSNSPYKTGSASDENTTRKIKKSHPIRKEKLQFERNIVSDSGEDFRICKQPASFTSPSFLNRNVKKTSETSDKNSNINKKQKHLSKNVDCESNCRDGRLSNEGKFKEPLYSDQKNACEKYKDKRRFGETSGSYMTQENIARKNYEDQLKENVHLDDISKRKVKEFLAGYNKRERSGEQKRAIIIGPPGFKRSSYASSVSTNEAHKNSNLVSATEEDSYDSYESDRNFEEPNNDKDFNTEKEKDSMTTLSNLERVNQFSSSVDEKIPFQDCHVDLTTWNEVVHKTNEETEECQSMLELEPSEAAVLPRAIQVPEVAQNLPNVTIVNEDRCIVTHSKSPNCFYIITATATENINDYDKFHEELQTYCENTNARKFSNKNEIKISKACYYCCFNKMEDYDFNWFRCKIIDWLDDDEMNENKVRVLAVDDGFEIDVMIDTLRDYPQTKYLLPEMAVKCRLRNVSILMDTENAALYMLHPPKSTKNDILEQWPQVSIEFFNDLIQNSRINPFYVTDVYQAADCYEVDLCNNQRVSLSKVMVQMEYAVIIELDTVTTESDKLVIESDNLNVESDKLDVVPVQFDAESEHQLIESDLMKEQIKQAQGFTITNNNENPLDNLDDCKTNLNEAICDHMEGGYTPRDYTRLCKFTEKDGEKCFKGDDCHFEHKLPDPDGWTSDKINTFTCTSEIEMPTIGDKLTILVTSIKSVCRFYAHIKLSKLKRQIYSASKMICTANQFSKYINKPETVNCLEKFKILPAEGQLVIARSPHDNKWYRSRVLKICSEEKFDVFFIDYGEECSVKFNDLREIKNEHLGLPEQAIEFRISGIDPINTRDQGSMFKAAAHFAELALDHVLTALVINTGNPIEVEIYTDEGVNIGNYLKMLGLAKNRDTSYLPKMGQMALE